MTGCWISVGEVVHAVFLYISMMIREGDRIGPVSV